MKKRLEDEEEDEDDCFIKRDEITGKKQRINPLSKRHLSKQELEDIFES